MKTGINHSAKRALSLVLALVMLVGTLFTANVGINIKAGAETTATDYSGMTIEFWDGSTDSTLSGEGSATKPYLITSAEELNWVCTVAGGDIGSGTLGKSYKIDPSIDMFILQSQEAVTKLGGGNLNAGIDLIVNASSAEETRKLFEETAVTTGATLLNWISNGNKIFDGNFNGSGVPLYGLYAYGVVEGNDGAALFPAVDGGGKDTNASTAETDTTGIKIEKIVIKNSYFFGYRRVAAIVGTAWWSAGSNLNVYGCVNMDSCIVGNCYFVGQNKYAKGNDTYFRSGDKDGGTLTPQTTEMGFLAGGVTHDPVKASNCLVYGNKSEYHLYSCSGVTYSAANVYKANAGAAVSETPEIIYDSFNYLFRANKESDGKICGTLTDSVILGARFTAEMNADVKEDNVVTTRYCENVYTDSYVSSNFSGATKFYDGETTKGAAGMEWMPSLDWGNSWFAVEGEYPTPIKPDGWTAPTDTDSYYSGGTGTENDPYIIRSTDQLHKMIKTCGGYKSGTIADSKGVEQDFYTPYYYKVADDVTELYVNNATTQEDVVDMVTNTTTYNNWNHGNIIFWGNFDGNGVTLYGLVSKGSYNGFIPEIGSGATVKNIHFAGAYIQGAASAVVATNFTGFGYNAGAKWNTYLTNISVRESYIESSVSSTTQPTAGGLFTSNNTPDHVIISNCIYDGGSSTLIDAVTNTAASPKAGIVSCHTDLNETLFYDCISIGEHLVSVSSVNDYKRYKTTDGGCTAFSNCYAVLNDVDTTTYDEFKISTYDIGNQTSFGMNDMPTIAWKSVWQAYEFKDESGNVVRTIPLPIGSGSNALGYSQTIAEQYSNVGANANSNVTGFNGKYGFEHKLTGSGTAADPYLITNADELARAIASGGKHLAQKLYYKLTCDITLTGKWIDQATISTNYIYVPFEGTLDGAGHVVTGLSAVDNTYAGLIPVLNGGTVTNLHIRDSYAGVKAGGHAGIIAGKATGNCTITNCSVEGSTAIGATTDWHILGEFDSCNITNSYCITADGETLYLDSNGTSKMYGNFDNGTGTKLNNISTITGGFYTNATPNATWYKGVDGMPRLLCFAKAHTVTDVDGDGIINEGYEPADVAALRNNLLGRANFGNIYGDVNNDGKTNISDLSVICREIVGTRDTIRDGFWRSLETGRTKIYYAENDTQDMARKMELYLESVIEQVDVKKFALKGVVTDKSLTDEDFYTTAPTKDAIVFAKNTPTSTTYMNYDIKYNATTNVLTVTGGSFTAVEQAVLDFIAGKYGENKTEFTTSTILSGDILTQKAKETSKYTDTATSDQSYKERVIVGDTYYYYAWGDEFEGDNTTFSTDNWETRNYKYESVNDVSSTNEAADKNSSYHNLESMNIASIDDLWVVNGGKLAIWRGYNADVGTWNDSYSWGYKKVNIGTAGSTNDFGRKIDSEDIYVDPGLIQTSKSMLFKQGYAEMRASLPSDGHAFPAWWFYNGTDTQSNAQYDNRLYGKVYKLNSDWDGTANITPSGAKDSTASLATYKYEVPNAFLEFDIVEFMEGTKNDDELGYDNSEYVGKKLSYPQLTIHKNYGAHRTDGFASVHVPDWSTKKIGYYADYDTFNNTAGNKSLNHRYDATKYAYNTYSTGLGGQVNSAWGSYNLTDPTRMYTYGFSWTVTEGTGYSLKIYVDFNQDGNMATNECVVSVDQNDGHESKYDSKTLYDYVYADIDRETAVWNQYAYMLIDNAYYTSNYYDAWNEAGDGNQSYVTLYSDLLSQETDSWNDKTTFDIEYVRVYQQNGKRDIVTPETEDFNTGNHFGY